MLRLSAPSRGAPPEPCPAARAPRGRLKRLSFLRAAAAAVVALGLLTLAAPAQAQTSITLVSNTSKSQSGVGSIVSFDHAQAFTTGTNNGAGYKLTGVDFHFNVVFPASTSEPTYSLSIWSSTAAGQPDSLQGTLTNPAQVAAGINTFTATGAGIDLADNTPYFVVLDVSTGGTRGVQVSNTNSDDEDAGAAPGWSIADGSIYRGRESTTGSWALFGQSRRIAVKGYAKTVTVTAPGAPASLTATAGDARVTLAWTAPTSTGGGTITKYQYRYSTGATVTTSATWTDVPGGGAARTVTVGPPDATLMNGTQYAFELRAVNSAGNGAAVGPRTATPVATACAAPALGDRRVPWSQTDAPISTYSTGYGYAPPQPQFTIGATDYRVSAIFIPGSGTLYPGDLVYQFGFNNPPTTAQRDALQLHVCDTAYTFSAATLTGNSFIWAQDPDLDWSAISTRTLTLSLPANNPATGAPTITGTAMAGETLTAVTAHIADADGLPSTFTYQWYRVDADGTSNKQPITGATSETYILTNAEAGKKVLVEVSFTDDLGGMETLPSAAWPSTGTVTMAPEVSIEAVYPKAAPVLANPEFRVTISEAPSTDVTVNLEFTQDAAWIPTSVERTIVILAGDTTATKTFTTNFTPTDGDLTATVVAGTGYAPAAPPDNAATVAMVATPLSVEWTPEDYTVTEGESVDLTVTLRMPDGAPAPRRNFKRSAISGSRTALLIQDYLYIAVNIQVVPGDWVDDGTSYVATKTVTLETVEDEVHEPTERMVVGLNRTAGQALSTTICTMDHAEDSVGDCDAFVTITDDDPLALTGVAVTSTPRQTSPGGTTPDTYGLGETIEFTMTFNGPVAVTVLPSFLFSVGSDEAMAFYHSGTGTTELVFTHPVVASDVDADGISWEANQLLLSPDDAITFDTAETADQVNALLNHPAQTALAEHRVNGALAPACPAPSLGDRREVWSVTDAPITLATNYGYAPPIAPVFTIGATDYKIYGITVSGSGATAGSLFFRLTSDIPTTAQRAALQLHVCDTAYTFSDATLTSLVVGLLWTDDLDWSAVSLRNFALSLPKNNAATGAPTISGTAMAGHELSADKTPIMDVDGKPTAEARFSYQWIWLDADGVSNPVDISGATASNYTLTNADAGKKVKVRVSFTDNLGRTTDVETRTSAAYPSTGTVASQPAITIAVDQAVATGRFDSLRYTLSREGDTADALTVGVTLEPFAGNDWSLDTTKTSFDVTFTAGSSTATPASPNNVVPLGGGFGNIGFSTSATLSGDLTARLGTVSGYDTGDTAVTRVVVIPSGPTWVVKLTQTDYTFAEDGGAQPIVLSGRAASAEMPRPTLERAGRSALFVALISEAKGARSPADYASLTTPRYIPASGCSLDADMRWVCELSVDFTPVNDALVEPDEDLTLALTRGTGAQTSIHVQGPGGSVSSSDKNYRAIIRDDDFGVLSASVSSTPQYQSDTYGAREYITVAVKFNRAVTVTGSPTFDLIVGSATKTAAYAGGSGTDTLTFTYQVGTGDADTDGISWAANAFMLDGAALVDADGTAAVVTHAVQSALSSHKVAGGSSAVTAVTVSSVAVTSTPELIASGASTPDTYGEGETIEFTATFSGAVTVMGDPELAFSLNNPGAASGPRRAAYDAGRSSATALAFTYTVLSTDEDTDGIWVGGNPLKLDADDRIVTAANALVGADLAHSELGTQAGHKVDGSMSSVPNTPPTSAHRTVTVDEDTAYTFSAADFAFADGVDAVDDVLERVIVETPPAVGVLALSGTAVTAGQSVAADEIPSLVFTPAENGHGSTATTGSPYATFMFKVHDGRDPSAAAYTLSIDVTAVNDEPTGLLTIAGTLTVGQTLTADISAVSDADGLPDSPSGFTYAWARVSPDPVLIAGATEVNYTLVDADAGGRIRIAVFYTDNDGTDETVRSEPYPAVGRIAATVPGKPRGLAATPGNGQVTLEWTEPSSDGGASVTGYERRHAAGTTVPDSTAWTAVAGDGTVRTVVVTGLVNDQPYAFEVRAVNSVGGGPAADPATATPREGPQLASTPTVEGMRLTLTFNEPLDEGSVPAPGDFAVTADGMPVAVNGVAVDGATVVLTPARPAAHGEAWRVTYTRPAANPLQNAAGEPATVPPGQIVTNATPDTAKPVANAAATVDGTVVTLTYDEPLDTGSVPAPGDFTVTVEGTPVPVTDVEVNGATVNGATVTVTLVNAAQSGQPVTFGYTPGASPLQDLAGNEADPIPAGPAVNITADETAPVFQSATVSATVDGTFVTLTYDEPLDAGSVPPVRAFLLIVGASPKVSIPAVTEVEVDGPSMILTLAEGEAVAPGQAVRLHYAVDRAMPIRDPAGNRAAALSDVAVAHAPAGAPRVVAVKVTSTPGLSAAGSAAADTYGPGETIAFSVRFSAAVTVRGVPAFAFALANPGAASGARRAAYDTARSSATALVFTYTVVAADEDTDGIAWAPDALAPGAAGIAGRAAAVVSHSARGPLAGHKVDGSRADSAAPAPAGATVDGTVLTLTFEEALDAGSVPARGDFTVRVPHLTAWGETLTLLPNVDAVTVSGRAAVLTLWQPVRFGETAVTLEYRPGAYPLRDPAGNAAPGFARLEVVNITPDTEAPRLDPPLTLTGDQLTLTWSEPLDAAAAPAPGDFTVVRSVSGTQVPVTVDAVRMDGRSVVLTLAAAAEPVWQLKAGYRPGASPLQDLARNTAPGFAPRRVDNRTPDPAAPAGPGTAVSAEVNGTVLTLVFDERLDAGSVPAPGDFTVRVPHLTASGETLTLLPRVRGVRVRNDAGRGTVELALQSPVRAGDTVTLDYTPGASPLREAAGDAVPGFAPRPVDNLTPDTEAPRLDPPLTLTGDRLTLSWNEPLDEASTPAPEDFTVSGEAVTVLAVTVAGRTVVLRLAAAAEPVWQLKAGYRPGASPLRDRAGNAAPGFAPRRVDYVAPAPAAQAQTAGQPPGIARVAIAPDPDGDGAWEAGEAVEVTLTFDAPVEVDSAGGTPSLRALVGSTERELMYTRGSGTAALVFAWTPAQGDEPATSVLLAGNALALNGGAIRGTAGLDAELAHNGAARTGVAIADDAASGTMAPSAAPDETAEADTADTADTADAADAVDAPVRAPFGASFSAVPREHDGAAAFTLTLVFGAEPAGLSYRTVRDSLLRVSGATVTKARRLAPPSNRRYELTVAPAGNAPVRLKLGSSPACGSAGAVCTADGRALTGSVSVTVPGPAALTLADASVREAPGAVLVFRISLNRRRHAAVTVDYATADGGARAGADYIRRSGTLVFAAGERVKTVGVEVLDDSEDDDGETLTLSLSNARGAIIADGTATGTIHNSDPLPKGWLVRFGRAGAVQVLELLDDRFDEAAAGPNQLTLGGRPVHIPFRRTQQGTQGTDLQGPGTDLQRPGTQGTDLSPSPEVQEVEGQTRQATLLERGLWTLLSNRGHLQFDQRRFLSQSSFDLSLTDLLKQGTQAPGTEARGTEAPGTEARGTDLSPSPESHWSLWGRGALTHFSGADTGVTIDGDVLTGLLGVDYARPRWLAGVALAYHDGDGSYRSSRNGRTGALDSTLVSVNPYLRYALTERLSAWGALGYGAGTLRLSPTIAGDGLGQMGSDLSLTPAIAGDVIETDMQMGMGALGLRGVVYANAHTELALKSDAMWVRTASAETAGMRAVAAADSSRLRLLLSGRHRRVLANAALLSPSFELGIRYDDGAAETGFGMELGAGLRYADPVWGLTVETTARTLVAHADGGYEEWGLSGSLALDPGRLGRGLALRLDSGWGLTDSGTEALWQRQTAAGLAPQHNRAAPGRIRVEMGYGLDVPWTYGMLTPYSGVELAGGRRTLRLGWRFTLGQTLILSLDGERRETGHAAPEHALMLRTTLPW